MFSTLVIGATLLGLAVAQDTTPCESYDINTGKGTCNGINVDIGAVICGGGFDKSKCNAVLSNSDGTKETYYFKGTPTGLPIGTDIQSDCAVGDFPDQGGVAMAQTYQDASGNPTGCYPAADVQGSTLAYTAGGNGLQSVTIDFNVHTDSGGTQRDGFIKITCAAGGPTSNFQYTTVGDQGHQSQYEIDTTADCSNSGINPGPPGPAPPGPAPPGPPPPPAPPGKQTGGGGGKKEETGWLLVGLLLGGLFIYFAAGYTYNWKVKGAEPSERVPNKEFWLGLPGLIKDGFVFTKNKIRGNDYAAL